MSDKARSAIPARLRTLAPIRVYRPQRRIRIETYPYESPSILRDKKAPNRGISPSKRRFLPQTS